MTRTIYDNPRQIYEYNENPYNDLYIYYIEGRLGTKVDISDRCFIGNWEEDNFSFLFFSKPSDKLVKRILYKHPHVTLIDKYNMTYDQWQGGDTDLIRAGGFIIAPPWKKKIDISKEDIYIALDPGVVFGTGTHPTTSHCLEAVNIVFADEKIKTAIDLGTGTGLLALAVAKSGCRKVFAVDLNFLAAQTAEKNIRLNRLENSVFSVCGRAEDFISYPADLVVANIHYDVVKNLINYDFFKKKKFFIISGQLRSQAKKVLHALSGCPVKVIKKWEYAGIWHTYLVSADQKAF